jgi:hypothetical protein
MSNSALPPEDSGTGHSTETEALRERIAALAERYENTSRDNKIRPDVIAATLRDALAKTEASDA